MISTLGVARDKDGGSLRALCQACNVSGEKETTKACVLVTIYRRESDLFALLLRERRDLNAGSGVAKGGVVGGKLTVLCDMTLDDAVHLEPQSTPLVVKVVNTCGDRRAYLLEFGRDVDLNTFQRAFAAARGYFRQMLTLRTLVADSFWQGFSSGAGAPVRNEPHLAHELALAPPPGGQGQPDAGLRGKTEGPGAGGASSELLSAEISLQSTDGGGTLGSPSNHAHGSHNRQHGSHHRHHGKTPNRSPASPGAAKSPRRRGGAAAECGDDSASVGSWPSAGDANGGTSGAGSGGGGGKKQDKQQQQQQQQQQQTAVGGPGPLPWKWPDPVVPQDKAANKRYNMRFVEKSRSCHRCHYTTDRMQERGMEYMRFSCPQGKPHAYCMKCVTNAFDGVKETDFKDGTRKWVCPFCSGCCPCAKCKNKEIAAAVAAGRTIEYRSVVPRDKCDGEASGRLAAVEQAAVDRPETDKPNKADKADHKVGKVEALIQGIPPPKLTHYEGLFTKYMQTLPALERMPLTEDVCFLCKEGGNLVECDEGTDWAKNVKAKHASLCRPPPLPGQPYSCCGVPEPEAEGTGKEFVQCKKVYHAYCMGFALGDDELGSCPRHACLNCGEGATRFCRFCPVSLCDEHYRTDPSKVIGESGESMVLRAKYPFRRSRNTAASRRTSTTGARSRNLSPRSRNSASRAVASTSADGVDESAVQQGDGEPMIPLAARRTKRVLAATGASQAGRGGDGEGSEGAGGGGGGGGGGGSVKRSRVGSAAGGGGCAVGGGFESGVEFVCSGCKMAARRAVRQYGLIGALETGGLVLPYGESDDSGDESEPDDQSQQQPKRKQQRQSSSKSSSSSSTAPLATTGAAAAAAAAPPGVDGLPSAAGHAHSGVPSTTRVH